MTRRRLLFSTGNGSSGGGGDPLPPDPNLNTDRHVTQVTGLSEPSMTVSADTTFRTEYVCRADCNGVVLAYGSHTTFPLDPWTVTVAFEEADGTLHPVTWGGEATLTGVEATTIESDPLDLQIGEGDVFHIRTLIPADTEVPAGGTGRPMTFMAGNHLAGTWTPATFPDGQTPDTIASLIPVAVIGKARASTVVPAMIGDSIAAQGGRGWFRNACADASVPGLSFGRSIRTFASTDGREGDLLRAATHVVVQYGANDVRNWGAGALDLMWDTALDCYDYLAALNPLPTWQTTCTPLSNSTDGYITVGNQTPNEGIRADWNAYLRDGAPCDPTTRAYLPTGSTGSVIRAGDEGHPLVGIVDVAASVEDGGASAPTGRWIAPGGVPMVDDGVHPNDAAQVYMKQSVIEWIETLTV